MNDSTESITRWLLLIHQLPPKPDYLRVKVRRHLQRLGAVPLKNSVYVLPHTTECVEDFQWLRREIVDAGGEASVSAADFLEGPSDADLEARFRAASDAEYAGLLETARGFGDRAEVHELERLRGQLRQIIGRDFFQAAGRTEVEVMLRNLESHVSGSASPAPAPIDKPSSATWVTREGVHVDRMASAWLIRRFIDPGARFKFVAARGYEPQVGELRFDMFDGEFTHEGDHCTFETLLARFALEDPALGAVAQIVHDIDCKDDKFGRKETPGIKGLVRGIALAHGADEERLDAATVVFDALYRQCREPE